MNEFTELQRLVAEAADDVAKADADQKAAGVRVRKKMQEIKRAAQFVRSASLRCGRGQPADGKIES